VKKSAKTLWILLLTLPIVLITSSSVLGEKPPEYFIDEGKLPFDALPEATAYWGIHDDAAYRIEVPVLSMHTLGDPLVPFSMQQFYARRVAANGDAELLVQRAIRDINHCGFTEDELVVGFRDLANWVEHGVKPLGDDVLDPVIVADPDYGCAFTSEDRTLPIPLPTCP
jgi:hypothetical protein